MSNPDMNVALLENVNKMDDEPPSSLLRGRAQPEREHDQT